MPLRLHDHAVCACRHASSHASPLIDGFASKSAPRHYPPDLEIEPVHLKIDLHVEIDKRRASGEVVHTLDVRRDGARELALHAVDLDIFEVRDAAEGVDVTWRHDGELLTITWPEGALERGTQRTLHIRYAVEHPASGLYFSSPDASYPERDRWACTDHETERARHWLPCVDLPQVRCKLDFHLRAKKHYTILANGALMSEEEHEDGETKTAHWRLDFPCPSYITCFALGELTHVEDDPFNQVPIAYFAAAHHKEEDLERSFGRTHAMLDFLTKKLDSPYPYPKYYQFALPGIGGAMENISLVSWDDVFILDETLAMEWTWLVDQINIHEMAHSYFGDALVCRDFSHAWLKESWATYIESCWLEHARGEDELLYDFYRNQQSYFIEADTQYKRPIVTNVYDTSWHMYDRHLYPGGGARLHMLRRQLGDDVFWEGVRAYVRDHIGHAVETDDFRKALERASGKSLVRWFEQWIFSAGYPHIEVKYSWDEKKSEATFAITQKQVDTKAEDNPSRRKIDPAFSMTLEVGWQIDGVDHVSSIELERRVHQHTIKMEKKPALVRIDPDNKLVMKLEFDPGKDLLVAMMERSRDVIGRVHAAKTLIAHNKRASIERALAHYREESFWGVKQQIVQALGKLSSQPALDALIEIARDERDGLLLESVVRALGSFGQDERVLGATLEMIHTGLPYRARMAAYEVLGKQGGAAPFETLVHAAREEAFAIFPQSGALQGLAHTHRPEALGVLMEVAERSADAAHHRVRAAAVRAMGALAIYLDETQRSILIDALRRALRDEDQEVALAAAYALIAARASTMRGAIAAFSKTLAHQDRVGLLRALKQLSATTHHAKLTDMEERLAAMKKSQRELIERLEKLERD